MKAIPARFLAAILLCAAAGAFAQRDEAPPGLRKAFDRYSRAWIHKDWSRVLEALGPEHQRALLKDFESKDSWIKHQDKDFKDEVTAYERNACYRLKETLYTFGTMVKAKRPDGNAVSLPGWATFELMDGKWYLVDPVIPQSVTQPNNLPPQQQSAPPARPAPEIPSR